MTDISALSRWRLRVCLTLTALVAALGYALAAEKPGIVLLALLVSAVSLFLVRRQLAGSKRFIPRWVLNLMVLAAMLHLAARFSLTLDDDAVITRLADFLTLVMLVKMLDRMRIRDEMQLIGLATFVTIGALLTGQSLALGLALLLLMPMAITSAVLLQIHAGRDRAFELAEAARDPRAEPAINDAWKLRRTDRKAVAVALACTLMASVLAGFVFAVAPRNLTQQLVAGALGQTPQRGGSQTGFRDNIRLGESGLISESSEVVMDVGVKDQNGNAVTELNGPIYLRGSVLTTYDPVRGEWSGASLDPNDFTSRTTEGAGYVRTGEPSAGRLVSVLDITLRSPGANAGTPLFAPLRAVQFRGPLSPSGPAPVRFVPGSALAFAEWRGGRMVYAVTAIADYREPVPTIWADPDASVFPDVVRQLAASVITEAGIDPADLRSKPEPAQLRRAATAISSHLREKFAYTLDQTAPPDGIDPLAYFLTTTRAGHCEYFASAMTAMLQTVGVPARVVTGYAAAEFNDISGLIVVRQSDAHAWVEVRLEPGRWETFDPTPPAQLQSSRRASSSPWARARQAWEAIEFSWLDNVVAYESGLKLDVLANVQSRGDSLIRFQQRVDRAQKTMKRWLPDNAALGAAVVIAVLVALVVIAAVLLRYGLRFLARFVASAAPLFGMRMPAWLASLTRRNSGPKVTESTRFYADLLSEFRRAGLEKPRSTPPLQHAHTSIAAADSAAAEAAARASDIYYKARFGQAEITRQEQTEASRLVAAVRSRLANRERA